MVKIVQFLDVHDKNENKSLNGQFGVPHVSTTLNRRTNRKRKHDCRDDYIVLENELVQASQPKKAKIS